MVEVATLVKKIEQAELRIRLHIRRTPCFKLDPDPEDFDREVFLKLEGFQYAGSFKIRGVFNQVFSTNRFPSELTAASGGNHGAAVALAGMALGIPTKIFIPGISSSAKRALLKRYKANVEVAGCTYEDALSACEKYAKKPNILSVHAFNNEEMIFGSGVLARELENQMGNPDTVLVPVGGGGLISGISAWFQDRSKVVAVEPKKAATLSEAFKAGKIVDIKAGGVAADALGCGRVGEITFEYCKKFVKQSVVVSDEAIKDSQRFLWGNYRIAVEPAGATALAALLSSAYVPRRPERIAVICSGANVDPATFA